MTSFAGARRSRYEEEFVKTPGILVVGMALRHSRVALAGCSSRQAKSAKAGGPPPAVPVGVATVKQGDFNVYLTGLGFRTGI